MSLLLDAGAFIALERDNAFLSPLIKREAKAGTSLLTHGGIVGQVWRSGARQARTGTILAMCRVVALDLELGRRAGRLLGLARKSDVVDAALVLLAADGDQIVTSDPDDLAALADAAGVHVDLIEV
jgi:hypothetical protein